MDRLTFPKGFRESWVWVNPRFRALWVWFLCQADDDGRLEFSIRWGPGVADMSESSTRRFLMRAEEKGLLRWDRGAMNAAKTNSPEHVGEHVGEHVDEHVEKGIPQDPNGAHRGIISILNPTSYTTKKKTKTAQPEIAPEHVGEHSGEHVDEHVKKEPTQPKKPIKDPIKMAEHLDAINLEDLRIKYTDLDFDDIWGIFRDTMIEGTAKKPECNPYNYVNIKMAFRNWLEKRRKDLAVVNQGAEWEKF